MTTNKKTINKFCNRLEEKRFYCTYGKVLNIDYIKLFMLLGLVIPCGIEYIAIGLLKKYDKNKILFKLTIKN
jgi:hypothetical protein